MAVNGQLTSSMLAPLGFKDYYGRTAYLSLDAAASLLRLADRLGLTLGSADVSEAYRDIARQEALFTDRFTTIPIDGYQYTVRWDGKTWYLRPGVASAAVPGTSDHGWGNAVDARASLKVRMRANLALCREYGWTFPIKSEDWHALYTRSLDQHYGEDDVTKDEIIEAVQDALRKPLPGLVDKLSDDPEKIIAVDDALRRILIMNREDRARGAELADAVDGIQAGSVDIDALVIALNKALPPAFVKALKDAL